MDAEALQDWMQRPSPKPQAKLGDDENIPSIYDPNVMAEAARSGDVEVVKILIQQKYIMSTAMRAAAQEGHIDVMRCLKEAECPWDERTCSVAAHCGQLETLRWARENGCDCDERTCANAALGGHLEVLQWLRAVGCPWDMETCFEAVFKGHVEVLRWVRENGCPWTAETRDKAAAKLGYTDDFGNLINDDAWSTDDDDDDDDDDDEYSDDEYSDDLNSDSPWAFSDIE